MRRCAMTGARSSSVSTAWTPGIARAADFDTERMSAWGCGLRTKATCRTPGTTMSSTKRPRPRSKASSSTRQTRDPISDDMVSISDLVGRLFRHGGFGGFVDDVPGRRVNLRKQGVDPLGAYRINIEAVGPGLGEEGGILQGVVEGRDQGGAAVRRQAGWRRE